ncbi:formate dehydrogenase accessory sulfurtransferase FdhD [Neolewinella aurantiaca]|uniref:Sulfur carrier protein FdhD n=1 Tax=Neolewinella aurantiaca TaxID=2602767 RepID=A0A5C7FYC5_9BACT|nr:formate dehydrogenase accessory sulfurtransferase FdhD [Neolewinella aurantiaca]TXF90631.1 formate dehydrogenase accessory sulfurtransferase FdhD [Neolewinella aurantiaca]
MSPNSGLHFRSIYRFRSGKGTHVEDVLAVEEPLDIRIGKRSVAITMRTPGRDVDLALGFLFSEGILEAGTRVQAKVSKSNVVTVSLPPEATVDWKRLERHSYTSSSCGVCGKTSLEQVYAAVPYGDTVSGARPIAPEIIQSLPAKLRAAQELFSQTGGIHAAGLFDPAGKLLHFAEDVGRHNALDKLVGHYFGQDLLPLDENILLLSGRASFELIQKAAMAGIGLVAAVGAPSSLAVSLGEELGLTVCGFTSERGFNCYCGEERFSGL